MKKSVTKKFFAAVLSASILCATLVMPASAALPETDIVLPQYVGILNYDNGLTLKSGGVLKCEGSTSSKSGYYSGVFVELQQQINGSWTTIATWSNAAENTAKVVQDYSADPGTYRLLLTHISYNTNWQTVEYFYDYSNIVSFS